MLTCYSYSDRHLAPKAHQDQARLRKKVFVDLMGWDVPHGDDWEEDDFDREGAHYILHYLPDGRLGGCCRMIPTLSGSMVEKLWPEWVDGDVPRHPDIWELSRFAIDPDLSAEDQALAFHELNIGGMEYNRRNGAKRIMIFTELDLVKSGIQGFGVKMIQIGPTREMDGKNYVVILTEVMTPEMIDANARLAGLDRIMISEPLDLALPIERRAGGTTMPPFTVPPVTVPEGAQ